MHEGWHGDDYLILFADSEVSAISAGYAVAQALPGYEVVGLRGWDELIVRDAAGQTYSVPTVPLDQKYLAAFQVPAASALQSDVRYTGKVKWYLKPIVFGGDPNIGDNVVWIDHAQHAQLVTWWNDQYRALKAQGA